MEPLHQNSVISKSNWLFLVLFLICSVESFGQLTGTKTIGGSNPDYTTISEAVADLNLKGVSGPVIFEIRDGIYEEQLTIDEYIGNSCTNTVTFQSASGINSSVTIKHAFNFDNDYVIKIKGADGIILKNMTITKDINYSGVLIEVNNGTDCLKIENNLIKGGNRNDKLINSIGDTPANNDEHNYISNIFDTGQYGIYKSGYVHTYIYQSENNTTIDNNTFRNLDFGIWMSEQNSVSISNNSITTSNDAIYISDPHYGQDIIKNKITVDTGNGITILSTVYITRYYNTIKIMKNRILILNPDNNNYGINFLLTATADSPHIIANNFVTLKEGNLGGGTGIRIPSYVRCVYNSVLTEGPSDAFYSWSSYVTVQNNIFSCYGTGYALTGGGGISSTYRYNNYFGVNNFIRWGGAVFEDLTTFQNYIGDFTSVSVDPNFLSDTELYTTVPSLNEAATPISYITTDIDDNPRDIEKPDIGASEFEIIISDQDQDGIPDEEDNCVLVKNFDQKDTDGDGEGDACDLDDDGDGIVDVEDCEPLNPEIGIITWYPDRDFDGFGDASAEGVIQCSPPSFLEPYVQNNLDCNDQDSTINPSVQEIANDGIDQDCDGSDLIILGTDGCSADFWKNRITWCTGHNQQDDFYNTFGITNQRSLGNLTLLSSLDGTKGEWGKLSQQATAAILNWCDQDVLYSIAGSEIISKVQAVFNDPNAGRNEAKALRQTLEEANNAVCPLNSEVTNREGCSAEFWMTSQNWSCSYSKGSYFHSVFAISNTQRIGDPLLTLQGALEIKGGGFNKLAKEATAALLNACNPDVEFALTESQILDGTRELFDNSVYGNKDANDLSSLYAEANNAVCPLTAITQIQSTENISSTELKNLDDQKPTVYPNPIQEDGFWLSFPAETGGKTFEASIYDFNGRLLIQKNFEVPIGGSDIFWNLDHSNWNQGVYRLILRSGNDKVVISLMKN